MSRTTMQSQRPAGRGPQSGRASRRHGLASVLAMLYVVLISTLAVGFYVATTLSAQIARNDQGLSRAQAAADGGMQFVRYQLGAITMPPGTQVQDYLTQAASQLDTLIGGSQNMNGQHVQVTNGAIYIPSQNGWTTIDNNLGTQFRVTITQSGSFLVATAVGSGSGVSVGRAIQVQFQKAPKAGAILNFGVATKGTVSTGGSTIIQGLTDKTKGSVLSTDMTSSTPVSIGGSGITGDVSVVNPTATVAGGPIGGTSDPVQILQHIHKGVPAPAFPTIDTSAFIPYAKTNYLNVVGSTFNNVYIPANQNLTITGGTFNGVLYIQQPNVISFRGNTVINGVIVTDVKNAFNATANQISFAGTVTANPVSSLDPNDPQFQGLTGLTGSFLLAPDFLVSFTGNFGTVGGSIVAGQVSMTGNAGGTVQGSVIGMQDVPLTLNGHSSITISSTGTSNYPTGISFGNDFTPLPGTYMELTQ